MTRSDYVSPFLELVPAYGQDYDTEDDVKTAWESDTDFIVADVSHPYFGLPANKTSVENAEETIQAVNIRYCGLARVVVIPVEQTGVR